MYSMFRRTAQAGPGFAKRFYSSVAEEGGGMNTYLMAGAAALAIGAGAYYYSQSSSSMDSSQEYKVVFLGGGNAAGYAAREFINKGGKPGELCIITDEPYVSYERPALSKPYLNPEGAPRLPGFHCCVGSGGERLTPEWYNEKGIKYLTNTKITKADVQSKTLVSESGQKLKYNKLIVATGARAARLEDFKIPGADLKGIHYMRDVKDADQLVAAMKEAKESGNKKAVVVGGGYIGMEVACALIKNGLEPTLVFPESRLMERLFTPEMGKWYEDFYSAKGAKFIKGTIVTAVQGKDGKAVGATLQNGQKVDGGIVVVGTGARPNTELFSDQLKLAPVNPRQGQIGGIEVNEFMQSSNPDVYAVGDVAAFPIKMLGGKVTRQEHVTHCRSSAIQAIDHILAPAETKPYDYLPFFYSRVFDLSWQYYGSSENATPVAWKDSSNAKKFGTFWVNDAGAVTGAFMESGSPDDNKIIKAMVQKGVKVDKKELASKGPAAAAKLV